MAEEPSAEIVPEGEDNTGEDEFDLHELLEIQEDEAKKTFMLSGAINDEKCSYSQGYLKRQAVYSCLTCTPDCKTDDAKKAGFCLACTYNCHEGHDLVELYTKRNFRCDCGNSKFTAKCHLIEDKEPVNENNQYNQNFQGTYCVCHRPYPDPEDPIEDEMMQCIICEDWYHSRHLNRPLPPGNFLEMICFNCVDRHEFLLHYGAELPQKAEDSEAEREEGNTACTKPKEKCHSTTLFFEDIAWRKSLCTCPDCTATYEKENVLFLLDPEDPVSLYMQKGINKMEELIEEDNKEITNQLNTLDRYQLGNFMLGYNDLKRKLGDFFEKFSQEKKVIREEDVKELFKQMESEREKMKNEASYSCH